MSKTLFALVFASVFSSGASGRDLTPDEFRLCAYSSVSAPGIMAVNASIIIGYKLAGIMGSLVAILATVLPPLFTLSVVAYSYDLFATNQYVQLLLKGMQCGATAIIINVAIDLLKKELKKKLLIPILIIVGTFVANYFFDVNLMYAILVDALIGFMLLRDAKYS